VRVAAALLAAMEAVALLAGCGFDVQSADLFQVTRVGQGQKLTLLVNDGGTIACNRGKPKSLPDKQLLQARDLATSLNKDAKRRFRAGAHSVFSYTVKVRSGTFTFSDTAARARKELAQLELFVVQAAADPCGIDA
jgi:outer membrane lipopolysaccharide assembly protein LptE/RlpB